MSPQEGGFLIGNSPLLADLGPTSAGPEETRKVFPLGFSH